MPISDKQSISQMARLVSMGLLKYENQFAFEVNFKLRGLISQAREKAISKQKGLGFQTDKNIKVKFKGVETGLKLASHAATTTASTINPVSAVKQGISTLETLRDIRVENQTIQKFKQYKDYFPTDEMLNLFSALIVLTVAHRGYVESNEQPRTPVGKLLDIITARKEQDIDKMVNIEVEKIWNLFDDFVCDDEKYALFYGEDWSKKIRDLFLICELGDSKDPVGTHNNYTINNLWLNLFAYYLQGEGKDVQQSIMLHLKSIVTVISDMQTISKEEKEIMEKKQTATEERQEVTEEILAIQGKRQAITEKRVIAMMIGKENSSEEKAVFEKEQKVLQGLQTRQAELEKQLVNLKGRKETAEEGLTHLNNLNGKLEDLVKPMENIENSQPTLYLKYPSVEAPYYSPQFFAKGSLAELACITGNEDSYSLLNI